jgi:xylulokinase
MPLYLGLDSSTQSLTAVVIDPAVGQVVHQHSINFDADLPAYGTRHGVLTHADPAVVHAPPLMWVEALDRMLLHLGKAIDLRQVAAIAGSAQQHGSVYLSGAFAATLAGLRDDQELAQQVAGAFTRATAPVWLDSSTNADCQTIHAALGGPEACARLTGSAACERFTGPQIRRFARTEPAAWAQTAHVRLVSSFLASILAGRPAPTDWGDGSGMNLLDLDRRAWDERAQEACAGDLARRLDAAVEPWRVLGAIHPALASRFGFSATCQVVAWSGDNPNSAIGLGLVDDGACALSLGTSDVLFAISTARPQMPPGGHVFVSPTGDHMALFCFANGSLAREAVRDLHHLDWPGFQAAFDRTPPGNGGRMMLPWFRPEIVPKVLRPGVVRCNLKEGDADADCRAVVEGQFTSMRLRAQAAGIRPSVLMATGGAARDPAVLRVAADVFQCPVRRSTITNTAALGAAVRAAQAMRAGSWQELVRRIVDPQLGQVIEPRRDLAPVYDRLAADYAAEERRALVGR